MSDQGFTQLSLSTASAPTARSSDFNGDGHSDIAIGLPGDSEVGVGAGAVYLLFGPFVTDRELSSGDYEARFLGEAAGDKAGYSLDVLGDVNGDGFGDLVVGAYKNQTISKGGAAYIIFGGESMEGDYVLSDADVALYGGVDENLGFEVSSAGDLNGDGLLDVAINAYRYDSGARNAGRTFVFFGPLDSSLTLSAADLMLDGMFETEQQGATLAPVLDVTGDGLEDLIVASQFADRNPVVNTVGTFDEGVAYLVAGGQTGVMYLGSAQATILGLTEDENFGRSAIALGDLNGDNFHDFAIGSKRFDQQQENVGRTQIYFGPIEGSIDSSSANALLPGEYTDGWSGLSIGQGGDLNGDGYSELLIGANENRSDGTTGVVYIIDMISLLDVAQ